MPRKLITVLLEASRHLSNIPTDFAISAPLPVEESDVESAAEDVPPTNTGLAETNDDPADATMEDKEDEEEEEGDEDDEDPET